MNLDKLFNNEWCNQERKKIVDRLLKRYDERKKKPELRVNKELEKWKNQK